MGERKKKKRPAGPPDQVTIEPVVRHSADVVNAVETLRACERTLELLLHAEVSQREREFLLRPLRRMYLTLGQFFGNNKDFH